VTGDAAPVASPKGKTTLFKPKTSKSPTTDGTDDDDDEKKSKLLDALKQYNRRND
jgi:hypothetical protein